ncbi:hypothetical protein [Pedobacter miscanthi]|uniref:hypothetical protein n=1 Tax=Pedobacter miscanthi TaxID=2259170 RepID=UPI00292DAEDC|nr:hypothetical protein [Pedobacter miscanthi]
MSKIEFKAAFGDEIKNVELSQPNGGSGSYDIMIDRFYRGSINHTMDGWKVYFNTDQFTAADAEILIDTVAQIN